MEQQQTSPSRWTHDEIESIVGSWADMLNALLREYPGDRLKMWTRVPNVMQASARQCTRLGRWLTLATQALQIATPGTSTRDMSITTAFQTLRERTWGLPPDLEQAERRALSLLSQEIMAITAEARIRWDDLKGRTKTNANDGAADHGCNEPRDNASSGTGNRGKAAKDSGSDSYSLW